MKNDHVPCFILALNLDSQESDLLVLTTAFMDRANKIQCLQGVWNGVKEHRYLIPTGDEPVADIYKIIELALAYEQESFLQLDNQMGATMFTRSSDTPRPYAGEWLGRFHDAPMTVAINRAGFTIDENGTYWIID